MSETLDSIFNNIYLSEQESKTQHEYLSNIKCQIFASEKEVREIEQKYHDLCETAAVKTKRLSNRQVILKTLKIRNELLQERIRELVSEKESLLKNQSELKSELTAMRKKFCIEAEDFEKEFGFSKKREKSNFTTTDIYKCEVTADLSRSMPTEKNTLLTESEMERETQDLERIDDLLFNVDFTSSP